MSRTTHIEDHHYSIVVNYEEVDSDAVGHRRTQSIPVTPETTIETVMKLVREIVRTPQQYPLSGSCLMTLCETFIKETT